MIFHSGYVINHIFYLKENKLVCTAIEKRNTAIAPIQLLLKFPSADPENKRTDFKRL